MHPPVLVVGHDDVRLRATRDAFARGRLTNPVVALADAVEARAYVLGHAPYEDRDRHLMPAVVVSDLHLAGGSGLDVLRTVRSHLSLRRTPVILVGDEGGDIDEDEVTEARQLGAAAVLGRRVAVDALVGVIRDTGASWSVGHAEIGA
ncbi:response regulator [Nocardioides dongxiaopingii]|uniref:response regulator n=1 Tax=Nocardioides TaxID=1839 RepID=UPI0010C76E12|nr:MULTISPECIES: response regulator [Nocardioides]QCW51822.1 response regulator [Nocardioides sp. S-1144]